jgi:hypothetical protein
MDWIASVQVDSRHRDRMFNGLRARSPRAVGHGAAALIVPRIGAWAGGEFATESEASGIALPADDRFIDWVLFYTRIVFGLSLAMLMMLRSPADYSLLIGLFSLAIVEIGNFVIVLPLVLRRSPTSRTRGLLIDTVSLLLTGSGIALLISTGYSNAGAEVLWENFWPVYAVLVIVAAFHLSAKRMLSFTFFLTAFFSAAQLTTFPLDSEIVHSLPIRALFIVVFGLLLAGFASELQRRKARVEQSVRELHDQSFDTILLLATLVEARDDTTGRHLQRMQSYCTAMARELGLSEEMVETIGEASLIHDVGKAWTPEYILNKPGPLTAEERRVMERHVIDGERLLGSRAAYQVHRQVARSHHERWDGAGYPDRLAGEDIPLGARIVAVADVYDALTSKRPYKHAWSSRSAAHEIWKESGKQFDPEITAAFFRLLEAGTFGFVDGEDSHIFAGSLSA